jgi:hypothetical protein
MPTRVPNARLFSGCSRNSSTRPLTVPAVGIDQRARHLFGSPWPVLQNCNFDVRRPTSLGAGRPPGFSPRLAPSARSSTTPSTRVASTPRPGTMAISSPRASSTRPRWCAARCRMPPRSPACSSPPRRWWRRSRRRRRRRRRRPRAWAPEWTTEVSGCFPNERYQSRPLLLFFRQSKSVRTRWRPTTGTSAGLLALKPWLRLRIAGHRLGWLPRDSRSEGAASAPVQGSLKVRRWKNFAS